MGYLEKTDYFFINVHPRQKQSGDGCTDFSFFMRRTPTTRHVNIIGTYVYSVYCLSSWELSSWITLNGCRTGNSSKQAFWKPGGFKKFQNTAWSGSSRSPCQFHGHSVLCSLNAWRAVRAPNTGHGGDLIIGPNTLDTSASHRGTRDIRSDPLQPSWNGRY